MSSPLANSSAGAEFNDSGFLDNDEGYKAFEESLLEFTTYGNGYSVFTEMQQCAQNEQEDEGCEGDVFFNEAFEPTFERESAFEDTLSTTSPAASIASPAPSPFASPTPSAAPSEAPSNDSVISLSNSLDDAGITTWYDQRCVPTAALTSFNYTPMPHILAQQPEAPTDPNAIYAPLTTHAFRTAAEAKAHRRRARTQPKSNAHDIARVKKFGREYWVRRIFNSMINTHEIIDKPDSTHLKRFTKLERNKKPAFEALDVEATAHHVFDKAIAVHERGFNKPKVYHKNTVRGKLVDISATSLELRLSRICLVLQRSKSAVDDALRGGVTLALLCDNPEARGFTKVSNNTGNEKRGQKLKKVATIEKAEKAKMAQQVREESEDESQEQSGAQEISGVQNEE